MNSRLWLALSLLLFCVDTTIRTAEAQLAKPGLVATYRDGAHTVMATVPTPNFRLQAGESVDPRIAPQFSARWTGVLRISRAGKYRLAATPAKVQVKGVAADEMMQLATGNHAITIDYERSTETASLRLVWESEFFPEEPVPSHALAHLEAPESIDLHASVEHGRFLFAELGCANCHAAKNWKLQSRRGPDLSKGGSRLDADWIQKWLAEPKQYRPSAVMPVCLEDDQQRADVTAFLTSQGEPAPAASAKPLPAQIVKGKELFERIGCVKCHDKQNHLDAVGSKYTSLDALTAFIFDPHQNDAHGRMPQLFEANEQHQALAIASYLLQEKKASHPYPAAAKGDRNRGAKLFASNGCANCHALGSAVSPDQLLNGPAFGQALGLPLRQSWTFDDDRVEEQVTSKQEKVSGRTAFAPGRVNKAFDFDGKTFIELTHFHRPDTMTISVWIKTTSGGSILTWGRPGGEPRGSREFRMNIGQDGKNSVCYGEYNSDGGWRPVVVRPASVNLVDGKWHHLAVVRDGTDVQHYIDGKPEGKPGKSQPGAGDYTDRLLIGALGLQQNPSNRFNGQMDELSVWDAALTTEQIAELASGASAMDMAAPEDVDVKPFQVDAGCLAAKVKTPLPDYRLNASDRTALQRFLETVQPAEDMAYHKAPLVQQRMLVRQFRCTACHEMDDTNIQSATRVTDDGVIVHVERPPTLTGIGDKLTPARLSAVLVDRKRNRPWLGLRMPHFGAGVQTLPNLIAAGTGMGDDNEPLPSKDLAAAGLAMIGEQRGKAACIACHNYRGINRRKDGVVPAPDLSQAGKTVRRSWFERWMHDPQRLQPGTSMPQMFLDVSPQERELRINQLWSAIVHQDQLPLPKGVLDRQTEGTKIVVRDEPVVFRVATATPAGQIHRGINVGIPGGLNFTFDPSTCTLRYAWKGTFLDAGPAWNGRGGNPVKAGSDALATIKSGHSLSLIDSDARPQFLGYRLEQNMPVFRYKLGDATVEHRIDIVAPTIRQSYSIQGATKDVLYTGGSDVRFRSDTGVRDGETIRFPKKETTTFDIEIPIPD